MRYQKQIMLASNGLTNTVLITFSTLTTVMKMDEVQVQTFYLQNVSQASHVRKAKS